MVGTFLLQRLRDGAFTIGAKGPLRASTLEKALSDAALRFQYPEEKSQKAITPQHLKYIWEFASREHDVLTFATFKACVADLACAGFFFAMRSCEYSTVKQRGKTKLLTIGNVRFKQNDEMRTEIHPSHPDFAERAFFVHPTKV